MVIGYHAIFSTYGFWLPNDPRGSWSNWIRKWELLQFGPATKVSTRRSVASRNHDSSLRQQAKQVLDFPEVHLSGVQAWHVSEGFACAAAESGYQVYACSILPQHVHVVIGRHERKAERIVAHLKARASTRLREASCHPMQSYEQPDGGLPSLWARKCWKVFLSDVEAVRRAVHYVRANPQKEGKRPQRWRFVVPVPHEHALFESARSKLRR